MKITLPSRLLWSVMVLLALWIVLLAVPARYGELTQVSPSSDADGYNLKFTISFDSRVVPYQLYEADASALRDLGLSPRFYAAYITAWEAAYLLACFLMGGLILWKKPTGPFGAFSGAAFVLIGLFYAPTTTALVRLGSAWQLPARYAIVLGAGFGMLFAFLFPDGRFIPRWTRPLVITYLGWILLMPLYRQLNPFNWSFWAFLIFLLAIFSAVVAVQAYRYRRVSTPIQRQQTKWFVFGIAAMGGFFVIYDLDIPGLLLPALRQPGSSHLIYNLASLPFILAVLLLPALTVLVGILRYRLWDIDLIIRRSLIYGSLTVTLVLIYFSSVVFLQSLVNRLTMGSQNGLVTVISTLAIAGLFTPLRKRFQKTIDRRFYRHRYNLEQTLAAFSTSLRDQVDLDELCDKLTSLIQDTMQPDSVSLWIKEREK